ncbi:MAG: hypothetical protein R2680_11675 [Nitrososphaeraceae archaeon]
MATDQVSDITNEINLRVGTVFEINSNRIIDKTVQDAIVES